MFLKHNLYFLNISPVSDSAFRCLFLLTTLLFWASNSLITAQQAPKSPQTTQKIIGFLATIKVSFALFSATNNAKTFLNLCLQFSSCCRHFKQPLIAIIMCVF